MNKLRYLVIKLFVLVALIPTTCDVGLAQQPNRMMPASWAEGEVQVPGEAAVPPPTYHMMPNGVDQIMLPNINSRQIQNNLDLGYIWNRGLFYRLDGKRYRRSSTNRRFAIDGQRNYYKQR